MPNNNNAISNLYDIVKESKKYDYYYNENKLDPDNLTINSCNHYIAEYFKYGEKEYPVFDIIDIWSSKKVRSRPLHTVIFFLLFSHFARRYQSIIKDKIYLYLHSPDKYCSDIQRFLFIMCLYHDYGYIIENGRKDDPLFQLTENSTDEIKVLTGIDTKLFPNPYIKNTVIKYFFYRNRSDHGISGGTLLLYRLIANFHKIETLAGKEDDNTEFIYPLDSNIQWWKEYDFKFYQYISSIIIKHNIWFAYESDVKTKYKENGLENLIIYTDSQKLSFQKDPILFLFCLLDTIEPMKKLINNFDKAEEISGLLRKIKIEDINVGEFDFIINFNDLDVIKLDDYICSILSLRKWMNIEIKEARNENNISLKFKFGDR